MRDPPLDVIKSWPKPNYVNPETQGPGITISGITFMTLATILVMLRVYVRGWLIRSFGWDDAYMVAAVVRLQTPHISEDDECKHFSQGS